MNVGLVSLIRHEHEHKIQ